MIWPLVLLAGGGSARMGRHKGLLSFRGRPWIEAQLELFARAGGHDAVLVLADVEGHRAALPWLDEALARSAPVAGLQVRVVHQPRPEEGPFSSLRLTLAPLAQERQGAFVLPVDVPACVATFDALERALGTHDAAVPRFEGRGGHPVLLSPSFVQKLAAIPIDEPGARLDRALAVCSRADLSLEEPTVASNLNTPEAWAAWIASADALRCYPPGP